MRAGTPPSRRRGLALALALCGALLTGAGGAWAQTPGLPEPIPQPAALEAVPPAPAESTRQLPTIAAIEVRADEEIEKRQVRERLETAIGQPFDAAIVRRLLTDLHASKAFEQIEIRQEVMASGEARLVVVLRGLDRVGEIELAGDLGLRERVLKRRLRLMVGAILDPLVIEADVAALRELYLKSHYREAVIASRVEPLGEKRFRVVYDIQAGPRARRGTITIEGDLGTFDQATLLERLRSKPGQRPAQDRLESDVGRLRRYLRRQGHLGATVSVVENYDPARHELDATFTVASGPFIELVATGMELETLRRRRLLVFANDGPVDDIALEQSRKRIIEDLQRRGHYLAQVTARFEPGAEGGRRVVFEVDPGPNYRLTELTFEGNNTFSRGELARHMSISPRSRWIPGSGKINDVDLDADIDNLTSFYRLEGFDQAEIGPPQIEATPPADPEEKGELALNLPIAEGRRLRVVDMVFDGVTIFETEELAEKLPLQPGSPFHPLLLDDTLNVIRALYEEEGHAWALVDAAQEWSPDNTLVDLTFTIDEGPRLELDHLIIRDQVHTKPKLIRRAVALEPGAVLSRRRLLRAQRDLYRLGIFSRVEVRLAPAGESVARRDVMVRVEEGTRWRLSYGVSYHSDDGVGGLLGVSRINLGGNGGRMQLDIRGSQRDQRLRLIYDRPFLGRLGLPFTTSIFLRDENRPAYDLRETGIQLSLTREFGRTRLTTFYDYRLVDLSTVPLDEELEREDAEVEISSFTPDLLIDRRDDPLNPTKGWSANGRFEYAFPFVEADADFLKYFFQGTMYLNLGRLGILAGSFRAGGIEPFGPLDNPDPLVPPNLASYDVPISERFFAGGRTSHRAYDRDELGILGETLLLDGQGRIRELGGNGMLLVNVDFRFPIAGAVGGVVFVDAGNIWASWDDVDTRELKVGAGIGVRYLSPIGPVRVEVGWKLDREPFEDSSPVILLSLGNPF